MRCVELITLNQEISFFFSFRTLNELNREIEAKHILRKIKSKTERKR